MEDRGEVATVILAKDRGWPTLMDDGWGKRFAKAKKVEIITTEDLCVEMAATGALSDEDAFEVFEKVYKTSRGQFDERVAALRP
jgi:predicted nucleic acid-binding protein